MKLKDWFAITFNIRNIMERFGYYKLSDLRSGGWCGLCGVHIPDVVVPDYWPYAMCDACKNGDTPTCSGCEYMRLGIPAARCNHNDAGWMLLNDIAINVVRPHYCPINKPAALPAREDGRGRR